MPINRPSGRDKKVTQGGAGVHRRGEGTGNGPVGSGSTGAFGNQEQKTGNSGGQGTSGGYGTSSGYGTGSYGSSGKTGGSSGSRPGKTGGFQRPAGGGYPGSSGGGYSGNNGSGSSGSGNSGGTRGTGGGKSPLLLLIILAVVVLGGGGGLSSLLGGDGLSSLFGGGGSTTNTGTTVNSGTSAGTSTSQQSSGVGSYQNYTDDTFTSSGFGSGFDLSSLSSLFGSGLTTTAAGISSGWGDDDNRGVLNTSVASGSRAKYTKLAGGGRDKVTIMVYMCGTDLESKSGMATSDIREMAAANLSDKINLLIYTGGCSRWRIDGISSKYNQLYRVSDHGLEAMISNDGDRVMTDPDTLTDFIVWCRDHCEADRYELIFWDHGSGSLSGYGYDEKHPGSRSMTLPQIRSAIAKSGVKFDFIGFDACLMATAENALALTPYADYLIASEETEPGTGWYYTGWLNALSDNTSIPTTELGKKLIDDFISVSAQQARGQSTTLSLVDLAELEKTLPRAFAAFAKDTSSLIENKEFKAVSTARSNTREFAPSSRIDQVDLTDLALKIGTDEGKQLASVLLNAIKYNGTSSSMGHSYGLSIYFPSTRLSKVDSMVSTYKQLGLDQDYMKCIQQFATVSASGQAVTGGTGSFYNSLGGSGSQGSTGSGSSSSGLGTDLMMELVSALLGGDSLGISGLSSSNMGFLTGSGLTDRAIVDILGENQFDSSQLIWKESGDVHTLHLSEEQWALVQNLDLNMLFDDGEGYIDLGLDNVFECDEAGDLIGETDRTWISINGQPVAYYHIDSVLEGDVLITTGRVPCLLNGDRVDLIIVFDEENPYGYIAGARTDYEEGETDTLAKAMTQLNQGDTLDFLCDYYSYDGVFNDSYYLGEQMVLDGTEPEISNTDVGDGGALITYCFTDIYGQKYWTGALEH